MQQYGKTDDRAEDILRRIEGVRFKKHVLPSSSWHQDATDALPAGMLVGHSCHADRTTLHVFCKNLVFLRSKAPDTPFHLV
jgi:hypothetical protein